MTRREMLHATAGAAALGLATPARAQAASEGQAAADRLVAATGGRDAWTRIGGLVIRAQHHEAAVPAPYDNVIFMALGRPLMRFEGRNAMMDRVRVVNGERGTRRSEVAAAGPLQPEQIRFDLNWWEAHVYRNIWRLARRDPAITARLAADGRLELYRADGGRLMWYRLNGAGEPIAFGPFYTENATILGPLGEREGGLRSPVWTSSADGAFRVTIREWRGTPGAPEADYERP